MEEGEGEGSESEAVPLKWHQIPNVRFCRTLLMLRSSCAIKAPPESQLGDRGRDEGGQQGQGARAQSGT